MGRLSEKVALITGGAQGMGESHARVFVEEGAKVIFTDINAEQGEILSKELGDDALFLRHDVTSEADWKKVVEEAEKRFGRINVLVNNAGILGPISSTADLELESFESVCSINQTGVFLGMRAVLPSMLASGGGSIVNVSSASGIAAVIGSPNLAYVGSKFAVRGMTKQVAAEYGGNNIRVNSVHPGAVLTPMMKAALGDNVEEPPEQMNLALPRFANPVEISMLVVFLASDESSYITGSEQVIDGGWTAR